jgi:replicative superfamily II helicase
MSNPPLNVLHKKENSKLTIAIVFIRSLLEVLAEHFNAEIVAGTISSKQDAMDYMTWTYFFRRLVMNPTYYHLEDTDHDSINKFLSGLVEKATSELQSCGCLQIEEVIQRELYGKYIRPC